jgi:pimeloyl-ACP methyl ester carboxylesterase
MEKVTSKDGTTIAFDRLGEGPVLIMMGGALNNRMLTSELASLLAADFTVFNYDRRGRSDSTDTPPYSIDKEVDDLDAVVDAAGGSAMLFANCTGGMLALEAVAKGSAITKLVLYEPPYIVDDRQARLDGDFRTMITELLESGRRGDAVKHFLERGVGLRPDVVERVQSMPLWPMLEGLATSLPYDIAVAGDNSLPTERLPLVTVPTLVMDGTKSPDWQRDSVQALVDTLPDATRTSMEDMNHTFAPEGIAPVIRDFLVGSPR